MIIHDIFKRRKGTINDLADDEDVTRGQKIATLRLSSLTKAISDLYRKSHDSRVRSETVRLSPLRHDMQTKWDARGRKAPAVRPGGGGRSVGAHTVLLLLISFVLGLVVLLGVAAWNATKMQMAYVREQLEHIQARLHIINANISAGRIEETFAESQQLSAALNDFSRGLRMRLLLPDISAHPTDTQVPALTLEFIGHILAALEGYQRAALGIRGVGEEASSDAGGNLLAAFQSFMEGSARLSAASQLLDRIPQTGMPPDVQTLMDRIRIPLRDVLDQSQGIVRQSPVIADMLGARYPRRYAFLLQNADEMRPTGGFIGSVAFVSINSGKPGEIEFRDVYELDWKSGDTVVPEELEDITKEYGLRDSNRMSDFPDSGKEAIGFFERQGLETVDMVIAINHRLVTKLLRISGPVSIPALRVPLTADNFSPLLSLVIESKQNPDKPKEIMKEVIAAMSQKVSADPWKYVGAVVNEIRDGNVAAYSVHDDAQALLKETSVAGIMRAPQKDEDYLLIVESNMGGNKSDRYISQHVSHRTTVGADGTVRDTLHLTRQHTFSPSDEAMIIQLARAIGIDPMTDTLLSIMGKGVNKSLIRISIPLGSRVLSVRGVPSDIVTTSEQYSKTVLSFPINVAPGSIGSVAITYALPFTLDASSGRYALVVDKQIGQKPIQYEKRLALPSPAWFNDTQQPELEFGTQINIDRSQTHTITWKKQSAHSMTR